jgi:hypothetical protein
MKTNYNQVNNFRVVARNTAFLLVMIFPLPVMAAPDNSPVEAVVTHLAANVTGAEIQKALDALPAGGGEVVLPAGKFEIREPIVLRADNLTLSGAGPATVLWLADQANCPVIILGEPVNHPQKTVTHLHVRDLMIDGNRSGQQRELWREQGEGSELRNNGITIQDVSDSSVERVITTHCRSGGLVTTLGVQRLTVRELESFENEFDGMACYYTTDSLFTDLNLHDNPGAGISLDLAFNHNVISNAVLVANDLGIFMRASRDNQFHNVLIRDSQHYGVFMAQTEESVADGVRPAPQSECADNAFTNLAAANCGAAAFRVNDSTCTNNVVIRPRFAETHSGGLSLVVPNLVTVW